MRHIRVYLAIYVELARPCVCVHYVYTQIFACVLYVHAFIGTRVYTHTHVYLFLLIAGSSSKM